MKFKSRIMTIKALALMMGIALLTALPNVQASGVIFFSSPPQQADLGDLVTLQLSMDFTEEATLGGGVDIFYDSSILQFMSFTIDAGLGDDPGFRRAPDNSTGELNGLAFGNFGGLSGPSVVGELKFTTIGLSDLTFVTLAETDDPLVGAFTSSSTFGPQDVDFTDTASITVVATVVPLPAAGWFMLCCVLSLLGFTNKSRMT